MKKNNFVSHVFLFISKIVADVGQEIFVGCQALSQDVNPGNVREKVGEFYGLDLPPVDEPGPCWKDPAVVRQAKQARSVISNE
jgi:hypothetical protein